MTERPAGPAGDREPGYHGGTRPWVGWWSALRIARREAARAKGRSALVTALLCLPVVALSFAAASYDMFTLHPDEQVTRQIGAADAGFSWQSDSHTEQLPTSVGLGGDTLDGVHDAAHLLALLPAGTRIIPVRSTYVIAHSRVGQTVLAAHALDAADPLTHGLVGIVRGRAPSQPREAALSRAALRRLGATVGGRVTLEDGEYAVVGEARFPDDLGPQVLLPPDTTVARLQTATGFWLADTPGPVLWSDVLRLNESGIVALSRAVYLDPPNPQSVPARERLSTLPVGQRTVTLGILAAGLAGLEVVLLAGAAFAIGARRRRRDLALVASQGATPRQVRRIVLADSVVLGIVAALVGIVLGIAVAVLARSWFEMHLFNRLAGGYRVLPLGQLATAAVAVATGMLSALVPAFAASRIDLVRALTGRRDRSTALIRWVVPGVLVGALGAAVTGLGAHRVSVPLVLAGLVVGQLGALLCVPAIISVISGVGRWLPPTPRMALRDAGRNRAAAAPAIAAVTAAVTGSIAVALFLGSSQQRTEDDYYYSMPARTVALVAGEPHPIDVPLADRMLREQLPVQSTVLVAGVECPQSQAYGCSLRVMRPAEQECPYASLTEFTVAQAKAAAHDPRCARPAASGNAIGPSLVDDGTALAALTGADASDVSAARAVLAAGGVVVADPLAIVDGQVTVRYSRGARDGPSDCPRTCRTAGSPWTRSTPRPPSGNSAGPPGSGRSWRR